MILRSVDFINNYRTRQQGRHPYFCLTPLDCHDHIMLFILRFWDYVRYLPIFIIFDKAKKLLSQITLVGTLYDVMLYCNFVVCLRQRGAKKRKTSRRIIHQSPPPSLFILLSHHNINTTVRTLLRRLYVKKHLIMS